MKRRETQSFLHGTRVLDFTQVLSGPFCTQMLADLGANVIKIEPPYGDTTREWGPPFIDGESAYFLSLNRNKKSIALDLSNKPKATKIALKMARECDVLVENFRPGVMASLGLGYERIKRINPKIVYCSVSGYGQTGPLSHKPGYDIAAFAASGIMSITGEESGGPVKVGVPVADIGAGMFAAYGISSALLGIRNQPGSRGVHLDIGMYDSMISWLTFQAGYFFATGKNPKRLGSAHPLLVPYQAFKAKDRYFILAVGSDSIWKRACQSMGMEQLASDRRFATVSSRIAHRNELVSLLQKIFERKSSTHWLDLFDKAGVPSSPISTVEEALESSHTRFRKLIQNLKQPTGTRVKSIVTPVSLADRKPIRKDNQAPPLLGEHTVEILSSFGYTKHQISDFLERKIVSTMTN
jgi:crotonobetainyl-CoA:carnitine CoA-transferase CaiB-like acyl-CoA transferase